MNTILNSHIRTIVSKAERVCVSRPVPVVDVLDRNTTEEYAIAMLNRLSKLKPDDFRTTRSQSPLNFVVTGSMGKDCSTDKIFIKKTASGTLLSVYRGKGEFVEPDTIGEKTREISSRWTLAVTDSLPAKVRAAFDAAKENLDRIVKF